MNIIPFKSHDFSIRAVEIDGKPWFVGKDIAEALGYVDTVNAIKQHCKGVVKHHPILDSMKRTQQVRIINEPDLFRLIVNSQLPAAEQFERWVFEDVLPSIRKTGGYQAQSNLSPLKQTSEAAKAFSTVFRTMRQIGLDKNASAISANQTIRSVAGVNLLALSVQYPFVSRKSRKFVFHPYGIGSEMWRVVCFQDQQITGNCRTTTQRSRALAGY